MWLWGQSRGGALGRMAGQGWEEGWDMGTGLEVEDCGGRRDPRWERSEKTSDTGHGGPPTVRSHVTPVQPHITDTSRELFQQELGSGPLRSPSPWVPVPFCTREYARGSNHGLFSP